MVKKEPTVLLLHKFQHTIVKVHDTSKFSIIA